VDVPDHWTVLDLDPRTQARWVEALLDQRLAGHPEAARERPPARQALLDLLRRLHEARVFLAAILAGKVGDELVSASVTLAWHRPEPAGGEPSLAALREVYAQAPPAAGEDIAARRVEVVDLRVGGAVRVSTREAVELSTGVRVSGVTMTQYVVPVLHTGWLALLTAATGVPALAAGVEEVIDTMAASLRFEPRSPAPG
jgi:hypothetical protein